MRKRTNLHDTKLQAIWRDLWNYNGIVVEKVLQNTINRDMFWVAFNATRTSVTVVVGNAVRDQMQKP